MKTGDAKPLNGHATEEFAGRVHYISGRLRINRVRPC